MIQVSQRESAWLTGSSLDSQRLGPTILVVNEVTLGRELETLFLSRTARVLTAETGQQALELARSERPDLILTDLQLAGLNGDELCHLIKTDPALHKTAVIVMFGANNGEERARSVRAGADDLLRKPLNRVGLIEAINRFLHWSEVRGLPRIECSVPVGVDQRRGTTWCTARNLSRGGLFVETLAPAELETEVRLRFALPERPQEFSPTAQVVWRSSDDTPTRVAGVAGVAGMGLRFLEIDSDAEKELDDYVFHHRFSRELPPTGALT